MPDWTTIFNPGGSLKDEVRAKGMRGGNGIPDYADLYRGVKAAFVQEEISNGIATDMSALLIGRDLEDEVLYNGAVSSAHDIGNAYTLATLGKDKHLRYYVGVERLVTSFSTFIEFEFNQDLVHISTGSPWPLVGKRQEGDVLIRMNFVAGALTSVEVEKWSMGVYQLFDSVAATAGGQCRNYQAFMYCVKQPPILHPREELEAWDEHYNPVEAVVADQFVEVGIDVDRLVDSETDYSGVLIRTPEDIALNSLRGLKAMNRENHS